MTGQRQAEVGASAVPKYDVKLQLDDEEHQIHLEIYQQVISVQEQTEEEVVHRAKQQFRHWAESRGPEWKLIALRVPFAAVTDSEIRVKLGRASCRERVCQYV